MQNKYINKTFPALQEVYNIERETRWTQQKNIKIYNTEYTLGLRDVWIMCDEVSYNLFTISTLRAIHG